MFSFEYSLFEFHSTSENNKSLEIQYAYANGLTNSDNSTTSQEGAGNAGMALLVEEVKLVISLVIVAIQAKSVVDDSSNTGEVGSGLIVAIQAKSVVVLIVVVRAKSVVVVIVEYGRSRYW